MRVTSTVRRAGEDIGDHLRTWRKLHAMTAAEVATRAGISRGTLRRLENGDPAVSLGVVLSVVRALGQLPAVTAAFDPMNSDIGRLRSREQLPQRVRRS